MFIPLSFIFTFPFVWAVEPLIFIYLLTILFRFSREKQRISLFSKNPILFPLLLYFCVIFLNYVRNPLPSSIFTGVSTEEGGLRYYYEHFLVLIFYFITLLSLRTYSSKKIIKLILFLSVLTTFIGFLLFIKPISEFVEYLRAIGICASRGMVTGSFVSKVGEDGIFRSGILYSSPSIGVILLLSNAVTVRKEIKIILLSFFIMGITLSATRSIFGSLILIIFFLFFFPSYRKRNWFVLLVVLILLLLNYFVYPQQFSRIIYERSLGYRELLYLNYLEEFMQNPVFGKGLGTTVVTGEPSSLEYFLSFNIRLGGHSIFLGMLHSFGIIAFIPFIWILVKSIYLSWFIYKNHYEIHQRRIALFCMLFLIYCLIPFIIGGIEMYYFLYIVLGFISSAYQSYNYKK
jgi:hypothetical protein